MVGSAWKLSTRELVWDSSKQNYYYCYVNCYFIGFLFCASGSQDKITTFSLPFSDAFAKCQLQGVISLTTSLSSSQSGSFTVTHSTFCNRTQSLRPCCLCLPSFCHRSLAEIVHSLSPAAHRKECRQSRYQFHQGEVPKESRKAFNKKPSFCWLLVLAREERTNPL